MKFGLVFFKALRAVADTSHHAQLLGIELNHLILKSEILVN